MIAAAHSPRSDQLAEILCTATNISACRLPVRRNDTYNPPCGMVISASLVGRRKSVAAGNGVLL
ncbi:hypothetical protein [Nocardia vaccinii]|uniref:hypothetical protein n=1 Tax=Nocardia vaccinii TaxID=1822 RepID=UPI00082B0E12|nr:hypothetical protein [Nocardia vaccinii]